MKDLGGIKRLLVFTGEGKGKTTAALGMAFRAIGHGMRVKFIQFVKADTSTGEVAAAGKVSDLLEITQEGLGFVPASDKPGFADHVKAAKNALKVSAEALEAGRYGMVILDEVGAAINKNLVELEEVMDVLSRAKGNPVVVLTGRCIPQELISLADTVTEMKCIKHGLGDGLKALEGVEF